MKQVKKEVPRVVWLIRVSSQGQADRDTPQDQRAALADLGRVRPGKLIDGGVIEFAVSGAKPTKDRPDLQRLAWLADHGGFDEVWVRNFSRLTRHSDPDEQEAMFGIVCKAHARIVEADSGAVTDPRELTGRILSIVKAEGAAEERRRIVAQTQAGKRRLVAQGWLVNGMPPYGRYFDRETGSWKVNDEQVAIYRRLFDLTLVGTPCRQIAAILNSEGVPGPRGKEWRGTSIYTLIRDPNAIGRYSSIGTMISIPAIVDEATQKAAIARNEQNCTYSGPRPNVFALLRKLITCAVCGGAIYTARYSSIKWNPRVYYCRRGCGRGHARVLLHELDKQIVATMCKIITEPSWLQQFIQWRNAKNREASTSSAEAEIEAAERALSRLRRRLEKLVVLYTSGQIDKALFASQKRDIDNLRSAAEGRRDAAKAEIAAAEGAKVKRLALRASIEGVRAWLVDDPVPLWSDPQNGEEQFGVEHLVGCCRSQLLRSASALLWSEPERDEERNFRDQLRVRWRVLVEAWFPRGSLQLHPNGDLGLAGSVTVPSTNPSSHRGAGRRCSPGGSRGSCRRSRSTRRSRPPWSTASPASRATGGSWPSGRSARRTTRCPTPGSSAAACHFQQLMRLRTRESATQFEDNGSRRARAAVKLGASSPPWPSSSPRSGTTGATLDAGLLTSVQTDHRKGRLQPRLYVTMLLRLFRRGATASLRSAVVPTGWTCRRALGVRSHALSRERVGPCMSSGARSVIRSSRARPESRCCVSLRTSDGKTRVAEVAMLQALGAAPGAQVLFLAPFRSLAFEMEQTLSHTFRQRIRSVSPLRRYASEPSRLERAAEAQSISEPLRSSKWTGKTVT